MVETTMALQIGDLSPISFSRYNSPLTSSLKVPSKESKLSFLSSPLVSRSFGSSHATHLIKYKRHISVKLRRMYCLAAEDPYKNNELEKTSLHKTQFAYESSNLNLDSNSSNSQTDIIPAVQNDAKDSTSSSSLPETLPSDSPTNPPTNANVDAMNSNEQDSNSSNTSIFVSLLEAIKQNRIVRFVTEWPSWQQRRRLENLKMEADAHSLDAAKQTLYLEELLKYKPSEVIERFEQNEYASSSETVVLYLKALVATDSLSRFLPDPNTGKYFSGIPALMTELKLRSTGSQDSLPPGMTPQQPLHVFMSGQNLRARSAGNSNFMNDFFRYLLMCLLVSAIWTLARAGMRRYVNGVAGISSSAGMAGPTNVYSPKEFNKENIPEKNAKTFNDVKGCDEAKEELEEIVQYLKQPAKFTRLGGKLPKGVLLIGPPGTGKTLLAKAIAGEAGVPFFYRAGSEFEEMFVGVGARRVRALFQAAKKKSPCIVFIDEIDAIGSSRKHWEGHTKKTLNQLLVEMDGFEANEGIIVIAATNIPESLDSALTRPGRFDRHVVVPNPDVRGRKEILELYLKDKPIAADVDVKSIARGTPGFSGADLANLVNMAAVKAALDGIETISSVQLEYAKDKILMGAERKSAAISEESRKLTAYHESGHAVVALNTKGADPIHKATITPRGNALGMVTQLPDKDETSMSKLQMLARLDVCMGGRVAEEMIFGADHVTSGARSDLQQATKMAHHMVSECGMSDLVGPIYVDMDSSRVSTDMRKNIDAEVIRLLKEAYERVRKLLLKHESDLHTLAKALLENETLDRNEINTLISSDAESFRQQELSQVDS